MQRLLNIYYHCCYQGHWNELCDVFDYSIQKAAPAEIDLLKKCLKGAHQYCINNDSINLAISALCGARVLHKRYVDFEDLYDDVRRIIGNIKGIGDLTIYDTALRIGFIMYPTILPREYVYLARGSMDGANNLLGTKNLLKFREPARIFAPYFGNMSSHFIEDFLCVFGDLLDTHGVKKGKVLPPSGCLCTCAKNIQAGNTGATMGVHSCFCLRIYKDNGEIREKYADNGEQVNIQ